MITARPVKIRLETQPGNEDKFILKRNLGISLNDIYPLLGQLSHKHEGEARGLETLGKGEASAEEKEDAPAHLSLNQPPGNQGRGLLEGALGVRAGPEVVGLGQNKQQQHNQDGRRGLSYDNLVSVTVCGIKQVTPARDEDGCLEEPEENEDYKQNHDLHYGFRLISESHYDL